MRLQPAILLLVSLALPFAAGGRYAREAERIEADMALLLERKEQDAAIARVLPFGLPVPEGQGNLQLLVSKHMTICYDLDTETPAFVAHLIDASTLRSGKRVDGFRPDPRLKPQDASELDEYKEKVFDRGHLAPSADFSFSDTAMINSCLLSNVAPQHDNFNRGTWLALENFARDLSRQYGVVHCITGAAYDWDKDGSADLDQSSAPPTKTGSEVLVPSHFYKVLYATGPDSRISIVCYLIPHLDEQFSIEEINANFRCEIEAIEAISGFALPRPHRRN